jgi:hypothetical protein
MRLILRLSPNDLNGADDRLAAGLSPPSPERLMSGTLKFGK